MQCSMNCFNSKVPSLIANDWNTGIGFAVKYRGGIRPRGNGQKPLNTYGWAR